MRTFQNTMLEAGDEVLITTGNRRDGNEWQQYGVITNVTASILWFHPGVATYTSDNMGVESVAIPELRGANRRGMYGNWLNPIPIHVKSLLNIQPIRTVSRGDADNIYVGNDSEY